jgi:hypothetical protein
MRSLAICTLWLMRQLNEASSKNRHREESRQLPRAFLDRDCMKIKCLIEDSQQKESSGNRVGNFEELLALNRAAQRCWFTIVLSNEKIQSASFKSETAFFNSLHVKSTHDTIVSKRSIGYRQAQLRANCGHSP